MAAGGGVVSVRYAISYPSATTHVMADDLRAVCGKAIPYFVPKLREPGTHMCRRCTPETTKEEA